MLEDSCLGFWEKLSQQSGQCRAPSHCQAPWNSKGSVRWAVGMGVERDSALEVEVMSGGTWRSLDMVGVEKGARESWVLALMSS